MPWTIGYLYIGGETILEKIHPKEIKDIYHDDPNVTLEKLRIVKNIYDRRKISNPFIEQEISNTKMEIREGRLARILDKNAAK